MAEKDTIAAQVRRDSPLHERFEEYQEEQKFESRSEAVRALLRAGLDAHEEEQQEDREEVVVATRAEEWCAEKLQAWLGMAILSAFGFITLSGVYLIGYSGVSIIPDLPLTLAMVALFFGVLIFGGGAGVVWAALHFGFARKLALTPSGDSEVEA